MDLGEWVEFIQVLEIDRLAIVHKYRFAIIERALIEDMFTRLNGGGESCFETITLRGFDAAWTCIGLLVFGSHFLAVSAYWCVSAEKAEEPGHMTDGDALEASDWRLGGVGGQFLEDFRYTSCWYIQAEAGCQFLGVLRVDLAVEVGGM